MSLVNNVLKPLAEGAVIPLGLTAAASVRDAVIYMKIFGFGCPSDLAPCMTTSIISHKEMNYIVKDNSE